MGLCTVLSGALILVEIRSVQLVQKKDPIMKPSILCSGAMSPAKKMKSIDYSYAFSLCHSIFLVTFFLIFFTSLG